MFAKLSNTALWLATGQAKIAYLQPKFGVERSGL